MFSKSQADRILSCAGHQTKDLILSPARILCVEFLPILQSAGLWTGPDDRTDTIRYKAKRESDIRYAITAWITGRAAEEERKNVGRCRGAKFVWRCSTQQVEFGADLASDPVDESKMAAVW